MITTLSEAKENKTDVKLPTNTFSCYVGKICSIEEDIHTYNPPPKVLGHLQK